MNVILLGAGASKAFSRSKTGQRMPLAKDFFKIYRNLDIYDHPWVLRGKTLHYIRSEYGVDPEDYLAGEIDIEDIHSEVESRLLEVIKDDQNIQRLVLHGVFMELSSIFACVVNTIQQGPISAAHSGLAQRLSSNDAIITFNWDTLMDRALEAETTWRVDSGYGFSPKQVFRNGWMAPTPALCDVNAPKLLKLHGSSNWLTSHTTIDGTDLSLTQASPANSVWVVEDATAPYDCYAGRFMPGYERLSFGYYPPNLKDDPGKSAPEGMTFIQARPRHPLMPEGASGDSGLVSVPLIIPPVRNKRYDFYGSLFTVLWDEAEKLLTHASRIIVIGYSFPKTDLKSLELFKRAFVARDTLPEVTILDPSPSNAAEIFSRTLGIPSSHLTVLNEYFSEDYDLTKLKF